MVPKKSLVLELQTLAQSNETGIAELLRRAKVVASKLGLMEIETWATLELSGYPNRKSVPDYRKILSELRGKNPFHGWIPVQFPSGDPRISHFARAEIVQSAAEVEQIANELKGTASTALHADEIALLEMTGDEIRYEVARFYSHGSFHGILEAIRGKILDWSLDLERRGILGEGMTFNAGERATADHSAITIGTVIFGNHSNSSTISGSDNASSSIAQNSAGAVVISGSAKATFGHQIEKLTKELRNRDAPLSDGIGSLAEAIESDRALTPEQKSEAEEQLVHIVKECVASNDSRAPKGVLKALVAGFRSSISFSADLLQHWTIVYPLLVTWLHLP